MAQITASALRQNIYAILDEALETGVPVEIQRKGKILRIVPEVKPSKLARLKNHDWVVGDVDDLILMDWYSEWSEIKGTNSDLSRHTRRRNTHPPREKPRA